jgi:hypothetical protein
MSVTRKLRDTLVGSQKVNAKDPLTTAGGPTRAFRESRGSCTAWRWDVSILAMPNRYLPILQEGRSTR